MFRFSTRLFLSRLSVYIFLGMVVAAALTFAVYREFLQPSLPQAPVYDKTVYLRYGFLLKNRGSQIIEKAQFALFAPYPLNEKQKLITHTANPSSELVADDGGHYFFEVRGLFIPPFGSKTLTLTLEVATATNQAGVNEQDLTPYLENDRYLNMDDPALIELAKQFTDPDSNQTANNIYRWLVNNVQVLNYVAQAKGAKYAVEQKKGDCTEMMHAFMALARLNNIPTRAVGGFVVEGNSTVVHANDYHNWAEYYNGKRWVIVDAQKQRFDRTGKFTYVAFRYFDRQKGNQGYTQRFIASDKRIGVSML